MNYEDATWRCNRWVSQLLRILSQTTCMLIINFIQYFQLNITLHGFHFIKQFSTRQEFLVLISQNYISRALNLKFHVMYMNNVVLHWFHEIFSRVIYLFISSYCSFLCIIYKYALSHSREITRDAHWFMMSFILLLQQNLFWNISLSRLSNLV